MIEGDLPDRTCENRMEGADEEKKHIQMENGLGC